MMIVGADNQALDQIYCDVCRLKYLQQVCLHASYDLLSRYQTRVEKRNVGHH